MSRFGPQSAFSAAKSPHESVCDLWMLETYRVVPQTTPETALGGRTFQSTNPNQVFEEPSHQFRLAPCQFSPACKQSSASFLCVSLLHSCRSATPCQQLPPCLCPCARPVPNLNHKAMQFERFTPCIDGICSFLAPDCRCGAHPPAFHGSPPQMKETPPSLEMAIC